MRIKPTFRGPVWLQMPHRGLRLHHSNQGGGYRVHPTAKDDGNRKGSPKAAVPLCVEIDSAHRFRPHGPLLKVTSEMWPVLVRKT